MCYITSRTKEQRRNEIESQVPESDASGFSDGAEMSVDNMKGDMTYDDAQYFQRGFVR